MKKILPIILSLLLTVFLCAWGEKKAELLDDKKLIDLSAAIELAKPGADSSSEASPDGAEKPSSEGKLPSQGHVFTVNIVIRDREMTYNGVPVSDIGELENRLDGYGGRKVKVSLKDDFAEAHFYKSVRGKLKELTDGENFEFSWD